MWKFCLLVAFIVQITAGDNTVLGAILGGNLDTLGNTVPFGGLLISKYAKLARDVVHHSSEY